MTSQLASQLQKLQQRRVDDKRLADSFLFSKSDAKSFSREQVHELAVAGLQVLIATDNRFHSFLESLFDPRRIRQERKLLTTEQNHELDLLLDQFLTFLSPHLLLTPAQQAFEYLVRVHEVHVYNVSSVLRAFLPYHDHNLFARAILLVDFRGTGFEFLETNQERAAPLLREHLILACGESRKVLRLVCLSVAMSTRLKVHHPAANALFASVATALAVHRDAESMWRVLVPFVLEFLSGKVSGSEVGAAESQHAAGESETTILFGSAPRHGGDLEVLSTSLLVLAAWSSEVTFTVPMLSTMLKPVIHYMGESIGAHSALPLSVLLSVVEVLFQTQAVAVAEVSFTPQLAALLALPWDTSAILTALAPDFEEAEARRVCPFEATFQALVRHCLERLHAAQSFASVPAEVLRFLRTAAGELPLSERAVSHFLRALVAVDGELAEDTSARSFLQLSMSALERRYQRVFDATLAKLLEAPPAGTSEDHVARFLHRHLGGARYELLDIGKVAGHHGPPRLPLFACLLHSLPQVRSLAAKALSSMKLTELEASTGSSTSGMGGSLLELLAHVSQYEADETVARALVGASGAALKHLIEALTSSTATTPSEEGKHRYYYGAVQGLLRALLILASIHGNAMRQSIFATALQPNLARMGGKNAVRGTSPALQSMLLYHTTQLYLSLVDEAEGGAAAAVEASLRQAVTAGLTTTEEGLFASPLPSPLAKHKKKAQESSDEDDEESTSRRATTSQRGPSHVDVFSSSALLLAMAEEASARLPGCVEDLHKQLHSRHPLPTAQAHAAALEFALAAASSLRHNGETTAPLLLRFLLGSGNGSSNQGSESNGYLVALQQEQRTTARLAQSSEVAQRVGRGVTNSLLSDSYLPSNEATKMLAVVVQRVVAQLLCAADSDTSASTATVTCLMELLAYLGAPLPALASAPATLAPSFFALLEQHGGARRAEEDQELFPIPWQELIHNATYSAEVSSTGTGAANLSAVALTLLLPLRTTPGRPREATLQNLQDAILRGSSKSSTKPATSAMIVLSAAMEGPQSVSPTKKKSATTASTAATISVTTLSTIVEAMAKEESRLTATAAELVCSMLAEMLEGGSCMASLPFSLAREVVEHFFPAPSTTRTRKAVEGQAGVALNRLLPTVERLVTAAGAIESVRRHRGEALISLSQAAADFVEAVCRRMTPAAVTDAEAPVVVLCLHLLRYPFLRVEGSSSRGVYRHALTSLAVVLQQGLEGEQSSSVIIQASPRAKKGAKAGDAGELEGFFAKLATTVTPAVWAAVRNIGVDVAQLCVGTTGGFTRLFLPLLEVLTHPTKTTTVEARQEHLEVMNELLESLVPQEVRSVEEDSESPVAPVRWQAPANCATTSPLRYEHAAALLKIPQVLCKGAAASFCWSNTLCPRQCLRLLATILRLSPTIHFDDDESEESLAALVEAMLATYPLDAFQTLLHQGATHSSGRLEVMGNGSNRVVDAITRQVLLLAQQFVSLCLHQPRALCEHDAKAASRIASTVIKQGLVLMAGLLLRSHQDNEEEEQALSAEETASITRQKVDTVAELLRALAPLLTPQSSVVTSSSSTSSGRVVLHIPLLALLIRLESVERSEALGFRTAAEVCQSILSSFDAPTQMACISQLMRLVTDPHGQLASLGEGKDTDSDELAQLLRRMVKPNQIINRQEEVLNLICTTVKADSFLRPFIELQHRTNRHAPGSEDTTAAAREEEVKAVDGNDACMDLLVCSLELFAHFSELNAQTPNEATSSANKMASEEDAPIFGEGKAYTMVLELVAGNTLACVLSGINEPTFVECLKKLLMDSRTALQLKGLEVLLDRLHHSLPTVENTLSDEEVEQHRRDLRDPKKRITLNDLIRIKARPLTTKRSIGLWEHLEALLGASIDGTTAFIDDAKPSGEDRTKVAISMPLEAFEQVARISHLSVACMEELARIVASGGSTQAEKTLLNIHRGKRVTEPLLAKLFGNKARVEAVHKLVEKACDEIMPQLTKALLQAQTVRSSGSSTNAATNSPAKKKASRAKAAELLDASFEHFSRCVEEQVMGTMTLVLTALGTVVQAMGAAFTAPHSTKLLHTIVSACMHHVVELPTVIARGEVGGVLRFSALSSLIRCFPSCWQMSHPYLSPIIFAATHRINVDDAESHALSSELLTVLEALMEPQVFLDAAIICLRGLQHYSGALYSIEELQKRVDAEEAESGKSDKRRAVHGRVLRLQVESHSFPLFFQCIQRRVQNLSKDELSHMRSMSDEGASVATAQNNFWVASMQALASSPTVPPSEVVVPVLEAFTTFFLKFKAKHCVRIVRYMANWAFGGNSEHFSKYLNQNLGEGEEDEDDASGERSHAQAVSRRTVHAWLLFFALLNHLLEKLGSIMEFGFSEVLPYVVVTLSNYCSSSARSPAKALAPLIALTLEGALEAVRRMSASQLPPPDYDYSIPLEVFFATAEVFNGIMPALVHQLTNTAYLTDDVHPYSFRAQQSVIPAVSTFFSCLNSSKLQGKMQAELVRALRHPNKHVRRMTLLCLDAIYAEGGEELASRLMAEMLPTVVELTEDKDDVVVENARQLCTHLSHMTGQDVLHALR